MLRYMLLAAFAALALIVFDAPRASATDYKLGLDQMLGGGDDNTFVGTTVEFEEVNDDDGLYGDLGANLPTVTGDALNFTPVGYEATCLNCGSVVMVDDTLRVTIQANMGQSIPTVKLTEMGDVSVLTGGGIASSSLFAPVFIDIFEVDGVGVNNINANAQMVFTPSDTFNTDGDTSWTGMLLVDLNAILADAQVPGSVTRMGIVLDNQLTSFANGGGTAQIDKSALSIAVIPEPTTRLLLALGLLGLGLGVRSYRRVS